MKILFVYLVIKTQLCSNIKYALINDTECDVKMIDEMKCLFWLRGCFRVELFALSQMILLGANFSTQIAHTHTCHSPQWIDFLHIFDCEIHVSKILSIHVYFSQTNGYFFNIFCAALLLRHCNRHNTSAKHAAYLQSDGCSLVLWWKNYDISLERMNYLFFHVQKSPFDRLLYILQGIKPSK